MSGAPPPHHPHGRQAPSPNTAWNHLQVPNYYGRQPQHAHMSNEHPIHHQAPPTWHTPTTVEPPTKPTAATHSHVFNLEQMIVDRPYVARHSPGVDLTLQRNGAAPNGDLPTPTTPISLSVRDAKQINSLPPGAIDIPTKPPPAPLTLPPALIAAAKPACAPISPTVTTNCVDAAKNLAPRRNTKRVDSIIERLNPIVEKTDVKTTETKDKDGDKHHSSVIVQVAAAQQPEETTAATSSTTTTTTTTTTRDDDVISPFSHNEDSTDSCKSSRRKRKPMRTVRMTKDLEVAGCVRVEQEEVAVKAEPDVAGGPVERRRSESAPPGSPAHAQRTQRRKTSSESETIDNIAAMVHKQVPDAEKTEKEDVCEVTSTPAHTETTPTQEIAAKLAKGANGSSSFVEVENKLEEMFAGIADDPADEKTIKAISDAAPPLEPAGNVAGTSQSQLSDNVTSTSNDQPSNHTAQAHLRAKAARKDAAATTTTAVAKRTKGEKKAKATPSPNARKKSIGAKAVMAKAELLKDAYDSGSNASSTRARGPFVQIRGPRDSPLSISIVNTGIGPGGIVVGDDGEHERRVHSHKSRKFHDDSEYRQRVRAKGLHCSTLSTKYDTQTRDATWLCVFCKRGPHATEPHTFGPSRFTVEQATVGAPGDLFGPYVITTRAAEYQRRLSDPFDQQFRSRRARGGRDEALLLAPKKKLKRKRSESMETGQQQQQQQQQQEGGGASEWMVGIVEGSREGQYEVWAHEECIVWAPGLHLVGPKIVGLEEAVWTACGVGCARCKLRGANICCARRGCGQVMHFGCARAAGWQLDEETFRVTCAAHCGR